MQWLARTLPDARMKRTVAARQTVVNVSTNIVAEHRRAIASKGTDGQGSHSSKDKHEPNGMLPPTAGEHVHMPVCQTAASQQHKASACRQVPCMTVHKTAEMSLLSFQSQ